ncbi:MAG: carboxypeptidase regulatory-like domain-containing protein [Pyrinomonadaceae bacterium]|nr:carboxypeptidase regulatory-like domain-containing protein [Pyrinomonadaceae bacterium]MBP6214292.1 carboxypeptidase regulatory-like domain-containing protein [Pyrinomonadaceae bacterium]
MNAKLGALAAVAFALIIFSTAAVSSQTPEKILTSAETATLIREAAEKTVATTQGAFNTSDIFDRWGERDDLEGKTRSQLFRLLFADVQFVIKDPEIRTKVWKAWYPLMVVAAPTTTATQPTTQAGPVLDEDAAAWLIHDLANSLSGIREIDESNQVYVKIFTHKDTRDLVGKTRAQIMQILFQDVRSIVSDPAQQANVWKEWNTPPPQPLTPDIRKTSLPVVIQNSNNTYSTVNVPVKPYTVRIIDEKGRPVAGARVSIRLYSGSYGDGMFASIDGRSVQKGVIWTATTNSEGQCTFAVFPQGSMYTVSFVDAKGATIRLTTGAAGRNKEFGDLLWTSPETYAVFTPEAFANETKTLAEERKANVDAIARFLAIPEDSWTRADGWDASLATAAVEANNQLVAAIKAEPYNALSEHQKVRIGLTLLKLALSPNSYAALKKLNDKVRTLPRAAEPGTFTFWGYATREDSVKFNAFEGQQISRSIMIPFKSVPDPEDYKLCSKAAEERSSPPDECQEVLNAYTPYLIRWGRLIYTPCLDDPNLPAIADELASLAKSEMLFPGPLWDQNSWRDARDNICSMLVKNEMAKDMERDGFGVNLINAGLRAGTMAARPPLGSVSIGGVTEKVTDQTSLIKWFVDRRKLSGPVDKQRGERKQEGESDQAFQIRVLALLRDGVEPVSGRRLDDSMLVYRIEQYYSPEPNTISVGASSFSKGTRGHLIKNYQDSSDLNEGKPDEGFFIGRVPPGKPMPDRRDVAIAVYGWPVGAATYIDMAASKDQTNYFVFVMKRWVMFNIRTGEIYGRSKVDGKLFP